MSQEIGRLRGMGVAPTSMAPITYFDPEVLEAIVALERIRISPGHRAIQWLQDRSDAQVVRLQKAIPGHLCNDAGTFRGVPIVRWCRMVQSEYDRRFLLRPAEGCGSSDPAILLRSYEVE